MRLSQLRALLEASPDLDVLERNLLEELDSATEGADHRCAILARSAKESICGVDAAVGVLESKERRSAERWLAVEGGAWIGVGAPLRIGLLFPGQGAPVPSTVGALGEYIPQAHAEFAAAGLPPVSPRELPRNRVQLALVASCLAALSALRELGVKGDLALGHSLGELVALHWAGALDAPALLRLARARGEAMTAPAVLSGAMATLRAQESDCGKLTAGVDVALACINAPRQIVVSGHTAAVETVMLRARELGIRAARLGVTGAFHSPLMQPAAPVFQRRLERERFGALQARVISSVTGDELQHDVDLPCLLRDQITEPVRFVQAARRAASAADLLIEAGPGQILAGLVSEIARTPVVSMRVGESTPRGLLKVAAASFAAGAPMASGLLGRERAEAVGKEISPITQQPQVVL